MSFLHHIASQIAPIYPMAKRWLYKFKGGIFPKYNKTLSTRFPVKPLFIPQQLILPLHQAFAEDASLLVKIGDRVKKNQLLAMADSDPEQKLVVPIHAPTSGIIAAIESRILPHASGLQDLCIILHPDGLNEEIENSLDSDGQWPNTPKELRKLLIKSGIIGMGGAGFPTYAKLAQEKHKIHTLIINGAECEPFISCDDKLMQTKAEQIWLGAQITAQALGCETIICGIESNKPKAIEAMLQTSKQLKKTLKPCTAMKVTPVATVYPMGGQKQLAYELTGIEIESRRHAVDHGLLMMNVATLTAIHSAVSKGDPLTSRIVTVSGEGLKQGFNINTLIGTPFSELVALGELTSPLDYPLIMGGPMMGVKMASNDVPILKTTNCVLVQPPEPRQMQMPCIRCGECMDACPVNLLPQQMYWHSQGQEFEKVEKLKVFDCIECGCCSYVCPSHIPLVQYYRHAKAEIKVLHQEQKAVELAKQRHEFKLERIEREKAEREARLKAKKDAVKKQAQNSSKDHNASDSARNAAQKAAAAKAKAAATKSHKSTEKDAVTKPLSAREKAIAAAQKAAANKTGQTDNDKKTKGQSLGTARDKAIAAAKKKAAANAENTQRHSSKTDARAEKLEHNSASSSEKDTPTTPPQNAQKAAAMAKARAKARAAQTKNNQNTSTTSKDSEPKSSDNTDTNTSVVSASEDSKTQKNPSKNHSENTQKRDPKKAALEAAKRAAAKRAAINRAKKESEEL